MRNSLVVFYIVGCLMMTAACTHIAPQSGQSGASIENRIQEHWTAKVSQEWKSVYAGYCSAYRDQAPFSDFLKMSKIMIEKFEVTKIQKDSSGSKADVTVTFSAEVQGHLMPGVNTTEVWVYENGNWYACPDASGLKTFFQ